MAGREKTESKQARANGAALLSLLTGSGEAGIPSEIPGSGPEALSVLTSLEEVRTAMNRAASDAQRLMSIFTPYLEPQLYDQTPFLEIIKRFVLGRSFAKVRVLISEHSRMAGSNNRFIAMARRLTSYIDIRVVATPYRNLSCAYLIADDRAIVYRLRADQWEGVAGFNHPSVTRRYIAEFDEIWAASAPDREVRVAHR